MNQWFDQNLIRFVENDLKGAISGCANFGAALMLVCYTEVLGGVKTGTLGLPGNVAANFNAGLLRLDEAAVADGCGANYYSAFRIRLNGNPTTLYDVLRCGLVHEFFGKGMVHMANLPSDPTGVSVPGATGVYWDGVALIFNVNAYFKHFKSAVRIQLAAVLADQASTGARMRFERAVATLSSKTIAP